jgi:RNA polymerase sigma factor (TIGR02999 family)
VAWRAGDDAALARLAPMLYRELHDLAGRCVRGERAGHSLPATALVNEAYLRLVDARRVNWQDRAHFLAMAARIMRRVLVEHARARRRLKRGGGAVRVPLIDVAASAVPDQDVLSLDEALRMLASVDERKSRVVELRFFGGLSVAETATVLAVSADTVMRDWKLARAWLQRQLRRDDA